MLSPAGRPTRHFERLIVASAVLGVVGALCGFFGGFLQRSPSNFAPCSVVFTIPLGFAAGWLVWSISEKHHLSDWHFVLLLAAVAVVVGGLLLAFIATRQ